MTPVSAEITLKFRKEGRFFSAVAGVMSESNRGSESKSESECESAVDRSGRNVIVGRLQLDVCSIPVRR